MFMTGSFVSFFERGMRPSNKGAGVRLVRFWDSRGLQFPISPKAVSEFSEAELLRQPNLGRKTIKQISWWMNEHGFDFGGRRLEDDVTRELPLSDYAKKCVAAMVEKKLLVPPVTALKVANVARKKFAWDWRKMNVGVGKKTEAELEEWIFQAGAAHTTTNRIMSTRKEALERAQLARLKLKYERKPR